MARHAQRTGRRLRLAGIAAVLVTLAPTSLVATAAPAPPGGKPAPAPAPSKPGKPDGKGEPAPAPPSPPAGPTAGPAGPAGPGARQTDENRKIVVKTDLAAGVTIDDVTAAFPVRVERSVLASRGIYLLQPTDPKSDARKVADLAGKIARFSGVVYAEPDETVQLAGSQFHGWPDGYPWSVDSDSTGYHTQFADAPLALDQVHQQTSGAGVKIAILDTGADLSQPALDGRVTGMWNYLADSSDVSDSATGIDDNGDGVSDSAFGHGTFVAGLAAVVAPGADIDVFKVLNSDGYGSYYEVAQAILDATADGCKVINLSFGTTLKSTSHVLDDAIDQARRSGVLVVAASGNDQDSQPHYPAADDGVLSVSALDGSGSALAWFSDYGDWADVAAPGQAVSGPLPDGRYGVWSGTSMAAPVVSGEAALLLSARPTSTSDQLYAAVTEAAHQLPKRVLRYGAIDIVGSLDWLNRQPRPAGTARAADPVRHR